MLNKFLIALMKQVNTLKIQKEALMIQSKELIILCNIQNLQNKQINENLFTLQIQMIINKKTIIQFFIKNLGILLTNKNNQSILKGLKSKYLKEVMIQIIIFNEKTQLIKLSQILITLLKLKIKKRIFKIQVLNSQLVLKIINKMISQIQPKIKTVKKINILIISIFSNLKINKLIEKNNFFNKKF